MFEQKQVQRSSIDSSRPPQAVDVLAGILERNRKRSNHVPANIYDAAHWWLAHQEPANEITERVERQTDKDGRVSWKTPYIDRVASTLRIFLGLSEPHKAFVIQKIDQGIPWRGDDMDMFLMICAQEDEMAKGKADYIQRASSIFQNFKRGAA